MRKKAEIWGKGIKERAVKERVTHCCSLTSSAGYTSRQGNKSLGLHTDAILLWWMGMRASLRSFGKKARIENVISISYFPLIFSIKGMLAHGWPNSMQFICSLIRLCRDFVGRPNPTDIPSPPRYRFAGVQSNAAEGSFWGNEVRI